MTLPVPSELTANVGDLLAAANWNSNVRDAINFLTNRPHFRGSITAPSTAIAASTNIAFPVIEDNYSGWNATGHYWQPGVAGLYFVTAVLQASGASPNCQLSVVDYSQPVNLIVGPASGTASFAGPQISGFVRCTTTTALALRVSAAFTTTSGSTAGVDTSYLDIIWISK